MIYLDHAATTPIPQPVADEMYRVLTQQFGNPSSQYPMGQEAKKLVEGCRAVIAKAVGCQPKELHFTSCGTESDNWAIQAALWQNRHVGRHIITTSVEHSAVLETCRALEQQGYEVTYLRPDKTGHITVQQVGEALREDTAVVSVMLVNNETGCVFPVAEIARLLKERRSRALLHTDAVQGFMKVPCDPRVLGVDMMSLSAHKIGGPKGIGALYIKNGVKLKPFIVGGSQETGRRAGTEAMPQIAAFGAACEIAQAGMAENIARMQSLRERAVQRLSREIPELVLIGGGSPHILSMSLPGWRSEVLMNYLEAKEVYVSRSSACKKGGRSHVLEAMGLSSRVIDGAIRIGLSRFTTEEDIDALCSALKEAHDTLAHR